MLPAIGASRAFLLHEHLVQEVRRRWFCKAEVMVLLANFVDTIYNILGVLLGYLA